MVNYLGYLALRKAITILLRERRFTRLGIGLFPIGPRFRAKMLRIEGNGIEIQLIYATIGGLVLISRHLGSFHSCGDGLTDSLSTVLFSSRISRGILHTVGTPFCFSTDRELLAALP
jgi:hypothetical protein